MNFQEKYSDYLIGGDGRRYTDAVYEKIPLNISDYALSLDIKDCKVENLLIHSKSFDWLYGENGAETAQEHEKSEDN